MASVVRELRVDKIAPGGEGVAFVDEGGERRAVFVPDVAVGDVVRAEIDLASKPARGRVTELLTPGGGRAEPACAFARKCGGCDLMHLTGDARREAYVAIVREVMPPAYRGTLPAVHAARSELGYRTRARVHVHAKRRLELGFLGAGSHQIVEVPACVVLEPSIDAARVKLAEYLRGAEGRGEARLALGAFPERLPVIDLSFHGELLPSLYAALDEVTQSGAIAGATVLQDGASRPATFGAPALRMLGADEKPFRLAPGGFGQASDDGNVTLGRALRAALDDIGLRAEGGGPKKASVVEFRGAGNFTVVLAARADSHGGGRCRRVREAARENLAHRGLRAKVTTKDADKLDSARARPRAPRSAAHRRARRDRAIAAARLPAHVISTSPVRSTDVGSRSRGARRSRLRRAAARALRALPQTSHVDDGARARATPGPKKDA
ncbi:MAG: hypothetical protein U0235_30830 [Polyangiaceae bacterium]